MTDFIPQPITLREIPGDDMVLLVEAVQADLALEDRRGLTSWSEAAGSHGWVIPVPRSTGDGIAAKAASLGIPMALAQGRCIVTKGPETAQDFPDGTQIAPGLRVGPFPAKEAARRSARL